MHAAPRSYALDIVLSEPHVPEGPPHPGHPQKARVGQGEGKAEQQERERQHHQHGQGQGQQQACREGLIHVLRIHQGGDTCTTQRAHRVVDKV